MKKIFTLKHRGKSLVHARLVERFNKEPLLYRAKVILKVKWSAFYYRYFFTKKAFDRKFDDHN